MDRHTGSCIPARLLASAILALATLLGACGSDSIAGPAGDACGPGPYFTLLPVPEANLVFVPVVGGVGAPGHTLPTDHGSLNLDGEGITLRAPGDMVITSIRRGRYTGPDIPPGREDYAIYFQVCRELTGWFGHVTGLAPRFSPGTINFINCQTYSVPFAEVESCEADNLNVRVHTGDDIATGGPVIDVGMIDQRVTNFSISPQRTGVTSPRGRLCGS